MDTNGNTAIKLNNVDKIFMLGDLHYGIRNNSTVWKNDMVEFMEQFMANLSQHGFNENTDILLITGDIFHSREFLNIMIGNSILDLFSKLSHKFKRGIYVILGNHDQFFKRNSNVHVLKFFERSFDNFHVFAEPGVLEINGQHRFLMLPWHDEAEILAQAIDEHGECQYLFCHMDISGFKYNKAIRVDGGMAAEKLVRFKRVYAGHLHHRQEKGNVLYLGTPYQMDFGDADTPRGYYVARVAEDMLHEEYFENQWSPKFASYEFEDVMNWSFDRAAAMLSKNYVNIHIPESAARNFPMSAFIDAMEANNISPRKIEFKPYDDAYRIDERQFETTSDFNLATAARSILEERKYSHSEIDGILSYFNTLYAAAKQNDKDTVTI